MEKVKIISFHHAHGPQASKLVEEEVNKFLENELPKNRWQAKRHQAGLERYNDDLLGNSNDNLYGGRD